MSPRLTVSQRLRGRLRELLKARGTATRLAENGGPSKNNISYFLNETPGRQPIGLDDLDEIAAFFRIDIGSLLGVTRQSELTGDEQRLLYAFRVLSGPVQDACLTVIEQASLAIRTSSSQKLLHRRAVRAQNDAAATASTPSQVRHAGDFVPADDPAFLFRTAITDIMQQLGQLITRSHAAPRTNTDTGTGRAPEPGTQTG